MNVTFTLQDLVQIAGKICAERDDAILELRDSERERDQLRRRADELKAKYEPEIPTFWRQIQVDQHDMPLDPRVLDWARKVAAKSADGEGVKNG